MTGFSSVTHFNMNTSSHLPSSPPTHPPAPQSNLKGGEAQRQIRSLGVKWLSAPFHPAERPVLHWAAPRCLFAHIYYSLCSHVGRLCYISNIKHSAIMWDVFDPGRNTLSLQPPFELKHTQPNDTHSSKHGDHTLARAEYISGQMDEYWVRNIWLQHFRSL